MSELTFFESGKTTAPPPTTPTTEDGGQSEGTAPRSLASQMSLFQLDESLCLLMDSALEAAAENNGEIPEEFKQSLLDYCEAFGQKVDNIASYIRSQECEAANAKTEIDRLEQRKLAAEHRVERLKGLVKYFMESRSLRSMKGRLNTISLRKNSQDSLILTDTAKLPAEFWRISLVLNAAELEGALSYLPQDHPLRMRLGKPDAVKREPDNGRLRAAITAGTLIEGAELQRRHHVRIT